MRRLRLISGACAKARSPDRVIRAATKLGTITTAAFYMLSLTAVFGVVPTSRLDQSWQNQRGSSEMAISEAEARELKELGPVSYLIVEFPGSKMTGEGLPKLVDLVDRGLIRILDLEFVTRDMDGSMRPVELEELEHNGALELEVFEGAFSGLLDATDFEEASSAIAPGSSAAILIFENRWAKPFVQALRRGGAQPVAAGYIPQDTLAEVVEATEH